MSKFSTLYKFLKTLKSEKNKNPIIPSNRIELFSPKEKDKDKEKNKNRKYALIRCHNHIMGDIHNIIDDHVLIEAHFSFDRNPKNCFDKTQEYTSSVHYTESWRSTKDNTEIVFHVYLDADLQYGHADSTTEAGDHIQPTPEQTEKLIANMEKHRPLLNSVLAEKKSYAHNAKQAADHLEYTLTELSKSLDQKSTRDKYIKISHEFIAAVKKFNKYSDKKDARDIPVLQRVTHIEAIHNYFANQNKKHPKSASLEVKMEKDLKEASETLLTTASLDKKAVQPTIDELYTQEIQLLYSLSNDFRKIIKHQQENVERQTQLIEQINEQLLVIYCFPEAMLKNDIKRIKKIISELNIQYNQYNHFLIQKVLENNLDAVYAIFPLIQKYLTEDFYKKLMSHPTMELIALYDYLYENDANYRKFLPAIIEAKSYPLSTILEKSSLPKRDAQAISTSTASFLYILFFQKKYALFETLLRHGVNPNGSGIHYKLNKIDSELTLFYSIIYTLNVANEHTYPYLRLLIQQGADPNKLWTQATQSVADKGTVTICKNLYKNKPSSGHGIIFSPIAINFPSSISILGYKEGTEGVELILETSSVSNLALCLGALINNKELLRIALPGAAYAIRFSKNNFNYDAQAMQSIMDTAQTAGPNQSNLLFVIYNIYLRDDKSQIDIKTTEYYRKIVMVQEALQQKIAHLTEADFQREYKKLLEFAQVGKLTESSRASACEAFFGAEFLLMSRSHAIHNNIVDQLLYLKNNNAKALYSIITEILHYVKAPYTQIYPYEGAIKRIYEFNAKAYQRFLEEYPDDEDGLYYDNYSDEGDDAIEEGDENEGDNDTILIDSHSHNISALCSYAADGLEIAMNDLLKQFPDIVNEPTPDTVWAGWRALHFACANDRVLAAKVLIFSGANLLLPNEAGKTATDLMKNTDHAEQLKSVYSKRVEWQKKKV